VTNTPPSQSPRAFNLSQPALVFIILLLITGALILSSTGLDPRSLARAQFTLTPSATFTPSITPTPIDPFAALSYVLWTSEGGLVSLEHPQLWLPQRSGQSGPVAYEITVPGVATTGLSLLAVPVSALQLQNPPANPTPIDYLRAILPDVPADQVVAATVAGLNGAHIKRTVNQQNPMTGQAVQLDQDIYLLSLDAANLFLFQAVAPTPEWPKMQTVLERVLSTLKLDVAGIVAALSGTTPTAEATQSATTQATAEATAQATLEPTAAATTAPTVAPTTEPTAEPTVAPTAAATP
jgi:hypothetical protein